jgi:hypothetical protein
VTRGAAPADTSAPPVPSGLAEVVADLDAVRELGPGRLDPHLLADAAALRTRIDERLAIGDALTVVAFVGGTGVGKSALLNRLVGEPVAVEGVRRPTTASPLAVSGRAGADVDALLRWLDVRDRRVAGALTDDLVLVDLPDHDSVVDSHRVTAERLRRRVDGLIVVLDPIKYARADLRDGPLAELHAHAEVTLVVFNRVDALTGEDRHAALEDARVKLREAGLPGVEVLPTSARTGEGIPALDTLATDPSKRRSAAVRRLAADAVLLGAAALDATPPPSERELDTGRLLEPLLEATGADRRELEAQTAYRADARRAVRSPLARAARAPFGLAARAAHRLGIVSPAPRVDRGADVAPRVEGVLARELELLATTGAAHRTMERTIARTAADAAPALADAVRRTSVRPPRRGWWTALSWLRGTAETALLLGLTWLVLVGVADWLQLPSVPTPEVTDELSWPGALLLAGLAARVVLGITTRLAIVQGGRRHRRAVGAQLRSSVRRIVDERITAPHHAEAARQRSLHAALTRLAASRTSRG